MKKVYGPLVEYFVTPLFLIKLGLFFILVNLSIGSTLIHTNLRKLSDLSLGSICKVCNSKIFECSIPNVIYQLTCKLCTHNNSIYIGETRKIAYKRLVEHWLATCNKNVILSSIAEHFNYHNYSHILSKNKPLLSLKIIDIANNYIERNIKEALWINKLKPTLNKNTGLLLLTSTLREFSCCACTWIMFESLLMIICTFLHESALRHL